MKKMPLVVLLVLLFFVFLATPVLAVDPPTYRGTIYGTGDWHFASLRDVGKLDFDDDGNMYVVEGSGPKIYKFDASGNFSRQWGSKGIGDGEFQYVTSVTADAGYVYALDYDLDSLRGGTKTTQIQSFDTNGNFVARWNISGSKNYKSIAAAGGYVYTIGWNTTTSKAQVQKFDHLGNLQTAFDLTNATYLHIDIESDGTIDVFVGSNLVRYSQAGSILATITPGGVVSGTAEDSSNNHYVLGNANQGVNIYDSSWTYTGTWGAGDISIYTDIAISPGGSIYIIDHLTKPANCTSECLDLRIRKFTTLGTVLDTWKAPGSDDGQFYFASDVAVDSSGNRYVLDLINNRVQVFDQDNTYLRKWTVSDLSDNTTYYSPGIAVDGSDNIYVTDTYNGVLYKYDSHGTVLNTISTFGNIYGGFSDPNHIDFDSNGYVFVSDDYGVWIFDSDGAYKGGIDIAGDTVFAIALDSSNNLYIGDDGDVVSKYTKTGDFTYVLDATTNWGAITVQESGYEALIDMVIDSDDNVYLLDSSADKVMLYNTNGDLQTSWGGWGMDNTHYNFPRGLAIDAHDTLYVADSWNDRVLYYSYSAITPFDTPTPSPTATPESSNVNQAVQFSNASAPGCNDQSPYSYPDLFQINTTRSSAKLYFTPLTDTNVFAVSFSTKPNAEGHGASVSLTRSGVQSFSVNYLRPNTIYYFKIRGQNGCATGKWSNIMKINTNGNIYYKNNSSKTNVLGSKSQKNIVFPTPAPIPQPTFTPVLNPIPKKFCLLWWCW